MVDLLIKTISSDSYDTFTANLLALLNSYGLSAVTVWRVDNNATCVPLAGTAGVNDGILDIYDLGYNGDELVCGENTVFMPDGPVNLYATLFCIDKNNITAAISVHEELSAEAAERLKEISPLIARRYAELRAETKRFELFVDYQKKIDFVKDSGRILKALTVENVITQGLDVFSELLYSEACFAMAGGFFVSMGITREDLTESIFMDGLPFEDYLKNCSETIFITSGLSSDKFNIINAFVIKSQESDALFTLFNIAATVVPDKEMSGLITHVVTLAFENAVYHEQQTNIKLIQAEMEQSVEIIKKFVDSFYEYKSDYADACYVSYPALSTGGDYATIRPVDNGLFACVADVCGKGYAAATLTVMLATLIDNGLYKGRLDVFANALNAYMLEKDFESRFITGFFCIFDRERKVLQYVNAGHEPAILIHKGAVTELITKNLPLGIMPERYECREIKIDDGDMLFIYSDGLLEYMPENELKEKILSMQNMQLKDMTQSLYTELVNDPSGQIDDFTCAVINFGKVLKV